MGTLLLLFVLAGGDCSNGSCARSARPVVAAVSCVQGKVGRARENIRDRRAARGGIFGLRVRRCS